MAAFPAQTPHVERLEDIPAFLWRTKEFADITIVSGDKQDIEAHKTILCVRNRFFHNCLNLGFAESSTNRVTLPEDSEIIEALLQHIYGVDIALFNPLDTSDGGGQDPLKMLEKLIQLYSCADKYGVVDLQGKVVQVFSCHLEVIEDPANILNIASKVYEYTAYFDVQLRSAVINHVQAHLDMVLSTEESCSTFLNHSELNLDILRRAAPVLQEQAQALKQGSAPTTPKKRKSPRIPEHTPGTYALRIRMS